MHFCTAFVAIAGDDQQVIFRDPFSPISWPEIEVLRQVHGDHAVREVKPFVRVEQSPRDEKERLFLIYGDIVGKEVYTGRTPNMEMDAAELSEVPPGTVWRNPITKEVSLLGAAEEEAMPEKIDGRSKAARQAKLSENAKQRPRDEKGRLLPAEPAPMIEEEVL